ncbi:serine/threonine-protein phosphatase 4 regulatory subunit 2-like [Macadamia integrifolia]|uniref:serine/threonine-protein phosphatase 4 regulatory subunit 2-like n=1 Tax=Macadamia integrifolia TaxID=60698 RepID=UPI001C52D6FA|nr:serine/threonine-protein phosphatase 4 regulatory subunit 2-like [Macadamia integrifolia]
MVKSSASSEDEKEMAEEDRLKRANEFESFSSSDDEVSPARSIFCLKKNVSLEKYDQLEDCYILEFDPFEKLSLKDDDDDDDYDDDEEEKEEEPSVTVHRSQVRKPQTSKHLIDCVVKEEIGSAPSSEDEDSSIGSIFCLKKNVSTKEFDEVEDCYILEFDPFESIDLSGKLSLKDDDDDAEVELSVIAQRGKVACVDFPHSRHLCAKFPFYKTPHEDYCEQCYCYVCDSAAPCKYWKSPGGHCNATDHDEWWENLRRQNVPAPAFIPN